MLHLLCAVGAFYLPGIAPHEYADGERVEIKVNQLSSTKTQMPYDYYSLPFCSTKPVDQLEHRRDYLGEVLEGNDLISSGLAMQFRTPVRDHSKICSMTLTDVSA